MRQSSGERALFLVSAATNGLAALAFAMPGSIFWRLVGMRPPAEPLFLHLFAALVALFGVAYLWIALDPAGKRALIAIATLGKLSVVAVVVAHYLAGSVPVGLVLAISADLLFAALFIGVLRRDRP